MLNKPASNKYIDDMIYVPVLRPGDKIYHYTSAAGLQGICEKEFWVTEHHFLNDPSEFQIATEVFCEVLETHISNQVIREKLQNTLRENAIQLDTPGKLGEKIAYSGDYVISFCLDADSLLMWSEYSDFMGYCMEFDFKELIDSFEKKVLLHGQCQ